MEGTVHNILHSNTDIYMLAQLSKKQSELMLVTPAAKMASQTREKRFNITNNKWQNHINRTWKFKETASMLDNL